MARKPKDFDEKAELLKKATIHMGKNWYLGNDPLQWILKCKTGVNKNTGEDLYETVAFCHKLEDITNVLFEKELKSKEYKSLAEIAKGVEETREFIYEATRLIDENFLKKSIDNDD